MKRIINFSGGKTSALMAIQNYREGDIVLFTDTMREHPMTYKFIDDFEKYENIPVTRITYNGGGFDAMLTKKGYRQIPNRVKRICTLELKIRTAKRYIRKQWGKQDYEWLIGFRADEWIRDEEMSAKAGTNRTYFQDTTYKQLLQIAQSDLFKGQNLNDIDPAFNCSCTN